MGLLTSNSKTKILDNSFLNFDSVICMNIVEVVFQNPNDPLSNLTGYRIKATTDNNLEFNVYEDLESGVKDKCIKFIEENWKKGKEINNMWLDLDKIIACRIIESLEPSEKNPLKIDYVVKLYAISSIGLSFLVASYVRPKGVDNNINEVEKFRLKYLK